MGVTSERRAPSAATAAGPAGATGFFPWSAATLLVGTVTLVGFSMRRTQGHLVYVLDDPAIHLSMADMLANHGTWGVVPGQFQSASSSPLWTALLAGVVKIVPTGTEFLPLVMNVAAGLWVLWILGRNQTLLRPAVGRWTDVVAVALLAGLVLFLPALALVGMEHTLHMALVLAAVVALHRQVLGDDGTTRRWAPFVLVATASLVRFETLFVAAGIGLALLLGSVARFAPAGGPAPWRSRLCLAAGLGTAATLPVVAFAAFNRAMGQGLLPNSVLVKGADRERDLRGAAERLTGDPLVAVLTLVAVGVLVTAWRGGSKRNVFPAAVLVVATAGHMWFAEIGWYERYQAYLLGIGVYLALAAAAEVVPAHRRTGVALLVAAVLLLTPYKWQLVIDAPVASDNTYRQRYHAAVFLDRYYDGRSVASGELGYVTFLHDGPFTDLLGLADYEVARARRANSTSSAYWSGLTERRGIEVAAVYPSTLLFDTPDSWILVGSWTLGQRSITAFESDFQFWATSPAEARRLRAHLEEFDPELPMGVDLEMDPLLDLRLAQIADDD
ncbi:MAG: hypothetical protein H0V33_00390 [Acidimicrobiia bacterium]|nr:hypothetical protein [Acidimicrobiia bacterium]